MTADVPPAARDLLEEHDAFDGADGAYEVTTTPFDATIRVVPPRVVDDLDALTDESTDGAGDDAAGAAASDGDEVDDAGDLEDGAPSAEAFDDLDIESEPVESDVDGASGDGSTADGAASEGSTADGADGDSSGDGASEDAYEAVFEVEMAVPRLDTAVADDDVSSEVEDAWHSTLDLRLEDAYDVAEVDAFESHQFEVGVEYVETRFRFAARDARHGVNDAKVIVDFVEGTYLQGVIPGYEYEDPVRSLLQRATQQAEGSADGAERGGTPL